MAPPLAPILGANGKCYRNTGTILVRTWDLMSNVRDIEAPLEFGEANVSSRIGGGFEQAEPTLGKITLSLSMLYNPADADLQALIAAAWLRQAVELLIMDADQTVQGSAGIRAGFKIFKSSRKEAVDGIMEQMFDLKLCYFDVPPAYVVAP